MDIVESLFTKNECYKTARKMKPAGIIVHSTGANNPYLKRYCDNEKEFGKNLYGNHWNQFRPNGQQICCHAFIGYDINNKIKVAHTLPYQNPSKCRVESQECNPYAFAFGSSLLMFQEIFSVPLHRHY